MLKLWVLAAGNSNPSDQNVQDWRRLGSGKCSKDFCSYEWVKDRVGFSTETGLLEQWIRITDFQKYKLMQKGVVFELFIQLVVTHFFKQFYFMEEILCVGADEARWKNHSLPLHKMQFLNFAILPCRLCGKWITLIAIITIGYSWVEYLSSCK